MLKSAAIRPFYTGYSGGFKSVPLGHIAAVAVSKAQL